MKRYVSLALFSLGAITLAGCKESSSEQGSSSTAAESSEKTDPGCSILQLDDGAKITCGSTSAIVIGSNQSGPQGPQGLPGAQGSTGPQGPQGPAGRDGAALGSLIPRLINGDGQPVGTRLISSSIGEGKLRTFTVWDASTDSIAYYENGILQPRLANVSFATVDCTGTGFQRVALYAYQAIPDYFVGQIYAVGDQLYMDSENTTIVTFKSRLSDNGVCTLLELSAQGPYIARIADPVTTNIPKVLTGKYRIEVQ